MTENERDSNPADSFEIDAAVEQSSHYMSIDRYDLAEAALERGAQRFPDSEAIRTQFAYLRANQKRWDEAREFARGALRMNPHSTNALFVLAHIEEKSGSLQAAEGHYLAALSIDPELPGVLREYGSLMLQTGRVKKSLALLELALESNPEDESTLGVYALVLEELKRGRENRRVIQTAIENAPNDAFAHRLAAHRDFKDGRIFRARTHAREALRLNPNDESVAEEFRMMDRNSRWMALPRYYVLTALRRIPGGLFSVCFFFVGFWLLGQSVGVPDSVFDPVVITFFISVLFLWLSGEAAATWEKYFPAR